MAPVCLDVIPRVAVQSGAALIRQGQSAEYRFFAEFQSHEPEFDYLKV